VFGDTLTLWQALGCCAIVSGVVVLAATEDHS
jgi:drug/metabolite transporter (DMT)-like permease